MRRRYWLLIFLMAVSIFIILLSKNLEIRDYDYCVKSGGIVSYLGDTSYCEFENVTYLQKD